MTTVEVLKAARARIERGWVQNRAKVNNGDGTFSYCAGGAIEAEASHKTGAEPCFTCRTQRLVLDAVGAYSLSKWNDAPGRTQAEVLQAFDKAIALAEAATSRDAAGIAK